LALLLKSMPGFVDQIKAYRPRT